MRKAIISGVFPAIVLSLALGAVAPVAADEEPVIKVARIVKYVEENGKTIRRRVPAYKISKYAYIDAKKGPSKALAEGETILVGETLYKPGDTEVILKSDNKDEITLDRRVTSWERKRKNWFRYTAGRIVAKVKSAFTFETEYGVATVRGTTFGLSADRVRTRLVVLDGEVTFAPGKKTAWKTEEVLTAGNAINASSRELGEIEDAPKFELADILERAIEAKTMVKERRDVILIRDPDRGTVTETKSVGAEVSAPTEVQPGATSYYFVAIEERISMTSGVALMTQDEAEAALVDSKYDTIFNPTPEAYRKLGDVYFYYELYEEAIGEYKNALEEGKEDEEWMSRNHFRVLRVLGDAHKFSGDNDGAIQYYSDALDISAPEEVYTRVDLYFALANAYTAKGEFRNAEEQYEQARITLVEGVEPDSIISLGEEYLSDRLIAKANEEYGKATDYYRYMSRIYSGSGDLKLQEEKCGEALNAYKQALSFDREDAGTYLQLANTYFRVGEYENALQNYENVTVLDPESYDGYNGIGICLVSKGLSNEAVESLDKAIKINPDRPEAYFNKGFAYIISGKPIEALELFDKAIETDPKYPLGYLYKVLILISTGNMKGAEETINKAVETYKPENVVGYNEKTAASVYCMKGSVLVSLYRLEEAKMAFKTAIEIDPDSATAYYGKGLGLSTFAGLAGATGATEKAVGLASEAEEAFKEAVKFYGKAIEVGPRSADNFYYKGKVLKALGKEEEAWEAFGKASEIYDDAIEVDAENPYPHVGKAVVLEAAGDVGGAERELDEATGKDPEYTIAYYLEGTLLQSLGRNDEALKCFEKTVELSPGYAYAYNNMGSILYEKQRYEEAKDCFGTALELYPQYTLAYFNKGQVLARLDDAGGALDCFDKAIELYPGYAEAYQAKALNCQAVAEKMIELGRDEEALEWRLKAIDTETLMAIKSLLPMELTDPKKVEVYLYIGKGDIYKEFERYDEALEWYDKAIEVDPEETQPYYSKASIFKVLGQYDRALEWELRTREFALIGPGELIGLSTTPEACRYWSKGNIFKRYERYGDALECYNKTIELDPEFTFAYYDKAFIFELLGRYDDALDWYDRAIEVDPENPKPYYSKASIFEVLERYDGALEWCAKTIEVDPEFGDAYYLKASIYETLERYEEAAATYLYGGFVLIELGQYEKAIESCDKVLEINPADAAAYFNKGVALYELGEYEAAVASYDGALEIHLASVAVYFNRGNALAALGEYKAAVASYDKALEIDPEYGKAYFAKGDILCELGEYEEAIKSYDKVIEIDPEDAMAYIARGIALYELGRYEEAIKSCDKAVKINPKLAVAYFNRGTALAKLGEYEEAIESYDKASEIDPEMVKGAYLVLRYVFGIAAGVEDAELLQEALECEDRDWPYPALRYFAGEISEADFLAEAGTDAGRLCEAHCYIGYVYKFAGDTSKAREHFGEAVATGRTDFLEYDLGVRELERLEE